MDRRDRDAEPEKKEEAQNATHQMMNLLFNLCFQGYVDLHPTITEPGPYQDANFQVPIAAGGGEEWKWKEVESSWFSPCIASWVAAPMVMGDKWSFVHRLTAVHVFDKDEWHMYTVHK